MAEEFLGRVSRPSRYLGNEINAVRKDHGLVDIKVALAFPDTYEIGMSHIGLKILYEILNRREDTAAERVFAPWKDMEALLRSQGRPLGSLESGLALGEFDILGFTLQYEMSYTNILNMLDLAGIPLLSSERDASFPLVIGGGPCAFNPEPLADFFDLFVIGDGEEVIGEIVDLVRQHKSSDKDTLLNRLGGLEGIYVPSQYEVFYLPDGRIREVRRRGPGPDRVRKRLVPDLDGAAYPCSPVLPYMKIVHDRAALEISRGCTRGCRFCQAGMIYRPVREREVDTILRTFRDSIAASGYEEVSLTSLSSGDYTALSRLVQEVVRTAKERHVGVSLPSLRPGALSQDVIMEILKIRKTGFTIAPEAGTQRLRNVINKGIDEEDILKTVHRVFGSGWEILKLYFMIGLPTETGEDLEGIIDLTFRALREAKAANPRFKQINVSLSPFVPKPHTPFQWAVQDRPEKVRAKYGVLKRGLKNRKVRVKWHDAGISMLEGVFSRGDRRLGPVLREAWRSGCRFDGWTEECDFSKWMESFRKTGIDPEFYLYRERELTEVLPWDHLDSGITKEFLEEEYRRSTRGEATPDCRADACSSCGACTEEAGLVFADPEGANDRREPVRRPSSPALKRFRIRYTKEGNLRFLSHLEVISLMVRAFSRAGIPLEYSRGFHPHPKIAMGPALPVGVSGTAEYLDVSVLGSLFEDSLSERLNNVLPEGVRVTGVRWIPVKAPAISSVIRFGEYAVQIPRSHFSEDPEQRIRTLMEGEKISITRAQKGRTRTLNIRPMIAEMEILSENTTGVVLRLLLQTGDRGGARLSEVVHALLNLPEDAFPDLEIKRIGLYTDRDRSVPFQERVGNIVQAV